MKTVGIICEYNPFHLGHLRQFHLIRETLGNDTAIVCVMSGNYTQRGEPAMWDKYTRANAAVACGADLVLELPVTKVLQSAEGFARGGVELLTKLGCVDVLCFGAECGDGETLMKLAKKLDSSEGCEALRAELSKGLSYAAARQSAAGDTEGLLSKPNNILAVEYCRAILSFKSHLVPMAIQRNGDYHAQAPDAHEPSATAVRALFPDGNWKAFIPEQAVPSLASAQRYDLSFGARAVLARLRALSDEEWENCAHGSEGLWSKAMKASRSESGFEDIIAFTKSKRYPRTRIQRLLMCAYLGITQADLQRDVPYYRILSASTVGRKLLRQIKAGTEFPLINPGEPPSDPTYYRLETKASDLFTLFSSGSIFPCRTEQNARLKI